MIKYAEKTGYPLLQKRKTEEKKCKEWEQDKNNPKGSYKTQIKDAIDSAIKQSNSYEDFLENIKSQGIEIETGN